MIRIIVSLLLAMELIGCAAMSRPLPKCDGYSRRPLNRSMWQSEDNKPAKQDDADAVQPTATGHMFHGERPLTEEPPAFAHFDAVGSYRQCQEG
ncbi:hypothetical protein GFM13_30320 [Rhizobium leguminosarum bv. viciae]|nr:hypothetical protein [Rhizobium bangladeshense]NKK74548.1 hypothetical protein [Rhizobium leguminosarum bv. viciae]